MAKPNKTTKGVQNNSSQPNKIGKGKMFFYWFIIPFLFALALLLGFAQITDVNIFEKAKELTSPEQQGAGNEEAKNERLEQRVVTLQAEIQEKEVQIDQLQRQMEKSEQSKEELLVEQERLLDEIESLQRQKEGAKRDFSEVLTTFENMSAKTAAPVITKMSDAEALRILTSLEPETAAKIYEKMTPEDAAKYIELMSQQ